MRYGKIENGKIAYAPKVLRTGRTVVVNPSEARLREAGYLPVVDERPETDDAHYAAPTGWEERDGAVRRTYEIRERPPRPPRTYSKYRLVAALMDAGVWPQVKAWIESTPNAYDLYLAAEDISGDEQLLADGIAAVKELLGWTDEQVGKVLAQAEVR